MRKEKGPQLRQQLRARHQKGAAGKALFILHILDRAVNLLLPLESAAVCAMAMALWVLPIAWAERGWRGGIGGEWLLILLAGAAGWRGMAQVARMLERRRK